MPRDARKVRASIHPSHSEIVASATMSPSASPTAAANRQRGSGRRPLDRGIHFHGRNTGHCRPDLSQRIPLGVTTEPEAIRKVERSISPATPIMSRIEIRTWCQAGRCASVGRNLAVTELVEAVARGSTTPSGARRSGCAVSRGRTRGA